MLKQKLKLVTVILLLICLIVIPLVGVSFGGFNSPSIFDDNAVVTNLQFGNGSSVYLTFSEGDDFQVTEEALNQAVTILQARLDAMGYSDTKVEKTENQIRVDVAQTQYIDAIFADTAAVGKWEFVGSDGSTTLCDGSMVESASVYANTSGNYGIELKFTEEGAEKFRNNTISYAISTSYIYFSVDSSLLTVATVPSTVGDTFSFGNLSYANAAEISTLINYGALPEAMVIDRIEPLSPSLPTAVIATVYAILALVVIGAVIFITIKGKASGAFAAMALLADVALIATIAVNKVFLWNFVTIITLAIAFIAAFIFQLNAVAPLGQQLKEGKSLGTSAMQAFLKYSMKGIWIHAAIFLVTLICWLFARGSFAYIVIVTMSFTAINFATYFIFTVFGNYTLAAMKKK